MPKEGHERLGKWEREDRERGRPNFTRLDKHNDSEACQTNVEACEQSPQPFCSSPPSRFPRLVSRSSRDTLLFAPLCLAIAFPQLHTMRVGERSTFVGKHRCYDRAKTLLHNRHTRSLVRKAAIRGRWGGAPPANVRTRRTLLRPWIPASSRARPVLKH